MHWKYSTDQTYSISGNIAALNTQHIRPWNLIYDLIIKTFYSSVIFSLHTSRKLHGVHMGCRTPQSLQIIAVSPLF